MKKFTSILLCVCLIMNIAIVGVLPVVAAGTSTRVTRTINFDDTKLFVNTEASNGGYFRYYYAGQTNWYMYGIRNGSDDTNKNNYANTFSGEKVYGNDGQSLKLGDYKSDASYFGSEFTLRHYNGTTAFDPFVGDYIVSYQVYPDTNTISGASPNLGLLIKSSSNAQETVINIYTDNNGTTFARNFNNTDVSNVNTGSYLNSTAINQNAWNEISLVVNKTTNEALLVINGTPVTTLTNIVPRDNVAIFTFSGGKYMYLDNFSVTTLDLSQDDYGQYFASTVNLNANGGTVSSATVETNGHGKLDLASLPTPTYDKYTFAGWYLDKACSDGQEVTASTQFTGGETIYAKWSSKITFHGGDEATGQMAQQLIPMGETVILTNAFVKDGAQFAGWSLTDGGEKEYDNGATITPMGDLDLYAIWDTPADNSYMAKVTTLNTTVTTGDTVTVYINVASKKDSGILSFNASEIVFSYDSDHLTFDPEAQTELGRSGADFEIQPDGTVKLVDWGDSQAISDGGSDSDYTPVYTLVFTAKAKTDAATVSLVSAKFGTREEASTEDLTAAFCDATAASVKISGMACTVTFKDDNFAGNEQVESGTAYTFRVNENLADRAYYDFAVTSVAMGGSPVDLDDANVFVDNGDGTWTVKNVSGDLEISGTRTGKEYTVTFAGVTEGLAATTDNAFYNADYEFSIQNDIEPVGEEKGYTYKATATVGGKSVTCTEVSTGNALENKYRIPGGEITDDVTITVERTEKLSTQATVQVVDETGAVGEYDTVVDKGENSSYTLTLTNVETGYNYTVTAVTGETPYDIDQDGNNYTIQNITGNVIFTVTRSVDITGADVTEYFALTGDAGRVWLICLPAAQPLAGRYYKYNGETMFYSSRYEAYCTLVADTAKPTLAAAAFSIENGTAPTVDYGMDVNKTGFVDANDAQFVWNMYRPIYSGIDGTVITVEKLLRADVAGEVMKVETGDVTAIVNYLLGRKEEKTTA